jgi:hypothetical protein
LKKGGQEGFVDESFEKIPLGPPFSKGEDNAIPPAVHLSTVSTKERVRERLAALDTASR